MMNCRGFGMKWLWPNLRYYSGITLRGLRKVGKNLRIAGIRVDI
jgi:hypothetical protein